MRLLLDLNYTLNVLLQNALVLVDFILAQQLLSQPPLATLHANFNNLLANFLAVVDLQTFQKLLDGEAAVLQPTADNKLFSGNASGLAPRGEGRSEDEDPLGRGEFGKRETLLENREGSKPNVAGNVTDTLDHGLDLGGFVLVLRKVKDRDSARPDNC